ncbi:MAG: hypothetical protein WD063_19880 [Pirellulales bacterium]
MMRIIVSISLIGLLIGCSPDRKNSAPAPPSVEATEAATGGESKVGGKKSNEEPAGGINPQKPGGAKSEVK